MFSNVRSVIIYMMFLCGLPALKILSPFSRPCTGCAAGVGEINADSSLPASQFRVAWVDFIQKRKPTGRSLILARKTAAKRSLFQRFKFTRSANAKNADQKMVREASCLCDQQRFCSSYHTCAGFLFQQFLTS